LRPVGPAPQLLAQPPQVRIPLAREPRDRDMIHTRRSLIGRHSGERRSQDRLGIDLVDRAVPLAAFDPLLEGRQHPLRPDQRFCPRPAVPGLACLALAGTCAGPIPSLPDIASPPSCTPSLPRRYPASSLPRVL